MNTPHPIGLGWPVGKAEVRACTRRHSYTRATGQDTDKWKKNCKQKRKRCEAGDGRR